MGLANLAQNLTFLLTVIPCEIAYRSTTCGAGEVFRNIAFHSSGDRPDAFVIALLIVRNEIFPVPILLIGYDFRKLINFEFLVLWRMGIIKSPLF